MCYYSAFSSELTFENFYWQRKYSMWDLTLNCCLSKPRFIVTFQKINIKLTFEFMYQQSAQGPVPSPPPPPFFQDHSESPTLAKKSHDLTHPIHELNRDLKTTRLRRRPVIPAIFFIFKLLQYTTR